MDNRCCDPAPRKSWLPLLICAVSLAPYLPLIWPSDHVLEADDYQSYQLPTRQFAHQEILNGRFPLWMPSLAAGSPLHAAQQAGLTYPLVLPFVLLPSVNYGLRLCLFLHLLFAYWGQYFVGRRFALSPGAAALSAMVTTLSGYAVGHLLAGHLCPLFAVCLFPWFFLALMRFLDRPGPLTAAGLTVCGALLLLTGHPQLPYYSLLFGTAWGLASVAGGVAAAHRWRTIGWAVTAGLVTGLIVLVQWLPSAELLADGHEFYRHGQADYFDVASMRPPEILILAVPNATGNPYANVPPFLGGGWRFHEKACYVGLLPLGLVAFGFTRRRVAVWQWSFLLASALTFAVAFGNDTPIMGWLTRVVPGLGQFRAPGRVLFLTITMFGLLAGRGFDDLLDATPRAGRLRQLALASAVVVLLLGVGVSSYVLRDFIVKYGAYALAVVKWEYARAMLLAVVSGSAFLLAVRLAPRRRWAAQLVLLATLAVDLWVSQARHIQLVEPTSDPGAAAPPAEVVIRFGPMDTTEDAIRYSPAIGVVGLRPWSTIETNEGGVFPASYVRLKTRFTDPKQRQTILRLSACDYRYDPDGHRWKPVPDSLPRVRVAAAEDVAEFVAATGESRCSPNAGDALVLAETPQEMTVRVRAAEPTVLIVADCYFPGWQAEVDGHSERVEPIHGMFRGVALPAGEHEVRFHYVSWPFRIGLAASVLGWLLLAGLIGLGVRQRRVVVAPQAESIVTPSRAAA